ncbi:hypothetical protein QBC37DRAFT_172132 [Rhypophila decipiens]|uniref:Uncharacterized protein n=1 Tax=Rhypophila decipiens TaxID=261697 RepID=A0AAN6YBB4_9PEZI|nr:hypothetical protein QBC37DRAFT_172132 [Rhypophila decipiens]
MWFNLDDFSAHASGRKKGKARKCIQSQLLRMKRAVCLLCRDLYLVLSFIVSFLPGGSFYLFPFVFSFCLYCLGDVGYLSSLSFVHGLFTLCIYSDSSVLVRCLL